MLNLQALLERLSHTTCVLSQKTQPQQEKYLKGTGESLFVQTNFLAKSLKPTVFYMLKKRFAFNVVWASTSSNVIFFNSEIFSQAATTFTGSFLVPGSGGR